MKILTGFAVVNDRNGKRITYTYDVADEQGNLIDSNKKASYIVLDEVEIADIEKIETTIESRLKA